MRSLVFVALLAACAAPQKKPPEQVAYSSPGQPKPKGVMHCHMERDTGSNMMEKVCTYDDRDTTAEGVDDGMIKIQQRALQHVSPPSGSGN